MRLYLLQPRNESWFDAPHALTANCVVTTSNVFPASRCSSVSPRAAMTVSPDSSAAFALPATISFVSHFWRRSEWPMMVYFTPMSFSMETGVSPVWAPVEANASCMRARVCVQFDDLMRVIDSVSDSVPRSAWRPSTRIVPSLPRAPERRR